MTVDPVDLEFMQRKAASLGLYVGEHRTFDPCMPGGPLFVQDIRKSRGQPCPSHLRYATAEMVWDFLNETEKGGRR
jgi:hypothetical protein